jgi:hypothetical protein
VSSTTQTQHSLWQHKNHSLIFLGYKQTIYWNKSNKCISTHLLQCESFINHWSNHRILTISGARWARPKDQSRRTHKLTLWLQDRAVGLGSSLGEDPSANSTTLLVWLPHYPPHHKKIWITNVAWNSGIKLVWWTQNIHQNRKIIISSYTKVNLKGVQSHFIRNSL